MSDAAAFHRAVGRIAIVGTGLLGASLGLGLRAAGFPGMIIGVGRRWSTVNRARERGGVDQCTTDLGEAAAASRLVVLATPLGTFAQLLAVLAAHDHPDLVVTDVGSTKQQVCLDAQRLLPDPGRFVGSHPMAGSERQGPDAARADLFAGRPCILTPAPDTRPDALGLVRSLWSILGMNLREMSAAEHDRKVAAISHVPHAVAAMLVELAAERGALDVASSGFRDTTRIASGDPTVWADIFATNRDQVVEALEAFGQSLARFRAILAPDRDADLRRFLQDAKDRRDAWGRSPEGSPP